ncbi:MAG TPA: hypothetical protein VFA48_02875 [Gammaproteobacteria bacterium]|nr:hypothetical protein [Gammaproteobacteria bacterium]
MYRKPLIAALALTLAPIAMASQAANKAPAVQNFSNTVNAKGLKTVNLEVKAGKVNITTNSSDKIIVTVSATSANENIHFIFNWTSGKAPGALPPGLHLLTHRDKDTLVLSLEPTKHSSGNDDTVINPISGTIDVNGHSSPGWKSNWTVSLPPRLALDLKVGMGQATVHGLAGGLHAKIGMGQLEAWLPQGPIEANVGMGDIKAYVRSGDYGAVNLTAGMGAVEFYVKGHKNSTGFEQHLTSSIQKLTGSGKTAYAMKAGMGHIKLELGLKKFTEPDANP